MAPRPRHPLQADVRQAASRQGVLRRVALEWAGAAPREWAARRPHAWQREPRVAAGPPVGTPAHARAARQAARRALKVRLPCPRVAVEPLVSARQTAPVHWLRPPHRQAPPRRRAAPGPIPEPPAALSRRRPEPPVLPFPALQPASRSSHSPADGRREQPQAAAHGKSPEPPASLSPAQPTAEPGGPKDESAWASRRVCPCPPLRPGTSSLRHPPAPWSDRDDLVVLDSSTAQPVW